MAFDVHRRPSKLSQKLHAVGLRGPSHSQLYSFQRRLGFNTDPRSVHVQLESAYAYVILARAGLSSGIDNDQRS